MERLPQIFYSRRYTKKNLKHVFIVFRCIQCTKTYLKWFGNKIENLKILFFSVFFLRFSANLQIFRSSLQFFAGMVGRISFDPRSLRVFGKLLPISKSLSILPRTFTKQSGVAQRRKRGQNRSKIEPANFRLYSPRIDSK